ncbi:hypothetical protein [Pseudonocardia sp. HH130630-07]|uniref:hypothetical protein n=1 Tax=Pseudonocardia sp. HH130630-07 TaxID=1690815 RepID=UPI000815369B|nr:hypothetical protein [Pseudonocardia sp. HH130630-07]ANY10690.1 hypothetical protein AFB00_30250 [Pseudonocardia sp. HH130630-07]
MKHEPQPVKVEQARQSEPAADSSPPPTIPPEPSSLKQRPAPRVSADDVKDEADTTATSQAIVYVSPSVRKALEAARRRDRQTNAELVFDAVDRTKDQLADLVADQNRQERPADSLFASRLTRTRRRAASPSERLVPFSFRATESEYNVLDWLVTDTSATSRSALVSVALEAVYGQRRRRR